MKRFVLAWVLAVAGLAQAGEPAPRQKSPTPRAEAGKEGAACDSNAACESGFRCKNRKCVANSPKEPAAQ
jgi:hypothetical protein